MDENDDIIIPEKKTNGLKFNLEELEKIKKQMLSGVCKIKNGISNGTGFFIKIIDKKNNNRKIGALITNAHVLGKNDIGKDEDIITYELNNKKNYIKGMKDRKRYIDEILDISIIEIKEKDQIKDEQYLEIEDIENDSLYKTESKQTFLEKKYKDIPIYAIGYRLLLFIHVILILDHLALQYFLKNHLRFFRFILDIILITQKIQVY